MSYFNQLVNVRAGELEQSILHRPVSNKDQSEKKQENRSFLFRFRRSASQGAM